MDVKGTLLRAFEEILDKMAFLYFEEPAEEDTDFSTFAFTTQIDFEGVIKGKLNVFFSNESAQEIARNLVGIRDEDELFEGTVNDAVLEFTNMVMGRTMTTLSPDRGFDMGVPAVVDAPAEKMEAHESLEILGVLDDSPCMLVLQYQPG